MPRLSRDDGSATVTAAGIISAVAALALVVVAVVAQVADSHRASVAADLAAVAAATAYYAGADTCAIARTTASLNGANLRSCEPAEGDVTVEVSRGRARSQARAGPAEEGRR